MKLPTPKRNRKKPLFFISILLVVVAGGLVWWQLQQQRGSEAADSQSAAPTNTVDYGPPTDEQKADQEQQKSDFLNNTTGDGSNPANPATTSLTVTISRAGQAGAGQPVSVRTFVDGTAAGSCDMAFSRAGSSFVRTSPIVTEASTATCNSDVEAGAFSPGEWQVSVVAKNQDGAVSQPATTAFTVQP